ncbi:mitochondrial ribosomal protein S18C [Megalopta genalis]|uniref:mitochondrial ribosomal protein S18C n=1 Tax=Megalopta genalis TaxID=115081 RepID=UPI001443414F|nr:28S ribosomal protein S18c, mitochondrial [Megalopta genalis]
MISTFINVQILRNVTNKVPIFLCHNKSIKTQVSVQEAADITSNPDLPTLSENPFKKERTLCILCKLKIEPDYKNVRLLSQFQSSYTGRIYGKHITGLCDYKQKRVEEEIGKAQQAGLMGFMTKDPRYVNDPKLFDHTQPIKPHPY